jgi:hypothetical protein
VDYIILSGSHGTLVRNLNGRGYLTHIGDNNIKTDLKNIIWTFGMDSSGLGPVVLV